jgi:hypothetical protein
MHDENIVWLNADRGGTPAPAPDAVAPPGAASVERFGPGPDEPGAAPSAAWVPQRRESWGRKSWLRRASRHGRPAFLLRAGERWRRRLPPCCR